MHQCDTLFVHWLAKIDKIMSMFVLFSGSFGHFEFFFSKMGGQTLHQSSQT